MPESLSFTFEPAQNLNSPPPLSLKRTFDTFGGDNLADHAGGLHGLEGSGSSSDSLGVASGSSNSHRSGVSSNGSSPTPSGRSSKRTRSNESATEPQQQNRLLVVASGSESTFAMASSSSSSLGGRPPSGEMDNRRPFANSPSTSTQQLQHPRVYHDHAPQLNNLPSPASASQSSPSFQVRMPDDWTVNEPQQDSRGASSPNQNSNYAPPPPQSELPASSPLFTISASPPRSDHHPFGGPLNTFFNPENARETHYPSSSPRWPTDSAAPGPTRPQVIPPRRPALPSMQSLPWSPLQPSPALPSTSSTTNHVSETNAGPVSTEISRARAFSDAIDEIRRSSPEFPRSSLAADTPQMNALSFTPWHVSTRSLDSDSEDDRPTANLLATLPPTLSFEGTSTSTTELWRIWQDNDNPSGESVTHEERSSRSIDSVVLNEENPVRNPAGQERGDYGGNRLRLDTGGERSRPEPEHNFSPSRFMWRSSRDSDSATSSIYESTRGSVSSASSFGRPTRSRVATSQRPRRGRQERSRAIPATAEMGSSSDEDVYQDAMDLDSIPSLGLVRASGMPPLVSPSSIPAQSSSSSSLQPSPIDSPSSSASGSVQQRPRGPPLTTRRSFRRNPIPSFTTPDHSQLGVPLTAESPRLLPAGMAGLSDWNSIHSAEMGGGSVEVTPNENSTFGEFPGGSTTASASAAPENRQTAPRSLYLNQGQPTTTTDATHVTRAPPELPRPSYYLSSFFESNPWEPPTSRPSSDNPTGHTPTVEDPQASTASSSVSQQNGQSTRGIEGPAETEPEYPQNTLARRMQATREMSMFENSTSQDTRSYEERGQRVLEGLREVAEEDVTMDASPFIDSTYSIFSRNLAEPVYPPGPLHNLSNRPGGQTLDTIADSSPPAPRSSRMDPILNRRSSHPVEPTTAVSATSVRARPTSNRALHVLVDDEDEVAEPLDIMGEGDAIRWQYHSTQRRSLSPPTSPTGNLTTGATVLPSALPSPRERIVSSRPLYIPEHPLERGPPSSSLSGPPSAGVRRIRSSLLGRESQYPLPLSNATQPSASENHRLSWGDRGSMDVEYHRPQSSPVLRDFGRLGPSPRTSLSSVPPSPSFASGFRSSIGGAPQNTGSLDPDPARNLLSRYREEPLPRTTPLNVHRSSVDISELESRHRSLLSPEHASPRHASSNRQSWLGFPPALGSGDAGETRGGERGQVDIGDNMDAAMNRTEPAPYMAPLARTSPYQPPPAPRIRRQLSFLAGLHSRNSVAESGSPNHPPFGLGFSPALPPLTSPMFDSMQDDPSTSPWMSRRADMPDMSPLTPSHSLPNAPRLVPRTLSGAEGSVWTGFTPQSSRNNSVSTNVFGAGFQGGGPMGGRNVLSEHYYQSSLFSTDRAGGVDSLNTFRRERHVVRNMRNAIQAETTESWRGWSLDANTHGSTPISQEDAVSPLRSQTSNAALSSNFLSESSDVWTGRLLRMPGYREADTDNENARASRPTSIHEELRRQVMAEAAARASRDSEPRGTSVSSRHSLLDPEHRLDNDRHWNMVMERDRHRTRARGHEASRPEPASSTRETTNSDETIPQRMNRLMNTLGRAGRGSMEGTTEPLRLGRRTSTTTLAQQRQSGRARTPPRSSSVPRRRSPPPAPLDADGAITSFGRALEGTAGSLTSRSGRNNSPSPVRASRLATSTRLRRMLRRQQAAFQGEGGSSDLAYYEDSLSEYEGPPPGRQGLAGRVRHGFSLSDYLPDEHLDTSYEGLLRLAARIGDARARGLPSHLIEALPTAAFKDCTPAQKEERCPICLDDYTPDDIVQGVAECNHYFHKACFGQWLQDARTCPVCRRVIQPKRPHGHEPDGNDRDGSDRTDRTRPPGPSGGSSGQGRPGTIFDLPNSLPWGPRN